MPILTARQPVVEVPSGIPGGLPEAALIAWWHGDDIPGDHNDTLTSWAPRMAKDGQASITSSPGSSAPTVDTSQEHRGLFFNGTNMAARVTLAGQPYTGDHATVTVFDMLNASTTGVVYSYDDVGGVSNKCILVCDTQPGRNGWTVGPGDGSNAGHTSVLGPPTAGFHVITVIRRATGQRRVLVDGNEQTTGNAGHNNLTSYRLGSREDESRWGNVRLYSQLAVDLSVDGASEAHVVSAHEEFLAAWG